ncbi:hypothetical protein CCR75_002687 [Bremia lactucae]|uniref:RING-type E3 ubiquitin transferase n=1 Tax=Bremia lactucae TaxID=4779 RepID=A0A976IGU3_BRELC|nr:hypothetical protein CCR75_002687 [Bremia lactucae]
MDVRKECHNAEGEAPAEKASFSDIAESKTQLDEVVDLDEENDYEEKKDKKDVHNTNESEDEMQFISNDDTSIDNQDNKSNITKENDVIQNSVLTRNPLISSGQSSANTDAVMAANGYITPATLEAELQCIICQYTMFKPISAICGHSFCRVCLLNSILSRPMEEMQCPICRCDIMAQFSPNGSVTSFFSINVTLWNLVQLLIPSMAARISTHQITEEDAFQQQVDHFKAQWSIVVLEKSAAQYHRDNDDTTRLMHDEFPVLKTDETQDGHLHVSRTIVLDTTDENEDGYIHMRVGLAIVDFPNVFKVCTEHQMCSINVLKMEEDEEMADGMPFFMNEDGDDDVLVCSSYFNELCLSVWDEAETCVLTRTRGAQCGVVTFPGLRLDVPEGIYTFRFCDNLYGLKLSITTQLRDPYDVTSNFIHDAVPSHRHGYRSSDSDDDDDDDNASDDSFIVNDLSESEHPIGQFSDDDNASDDSIIVNDLSESEHPIGQFSDDENDGQWHSHCDNEQPRQRQLERSEREAQTVDECKHSSDEEGARMRVDDGFDEREDVEIRRPCRRNVRVLDDSMGFSDRDSEEDVGSRKTIRAIEDDSNDEGPSSWRGGTTRIVDSDNEVCEEIGRNAIEGVNEDEMEKAVGSEESQLWCEEDGARPRKRVCPPMRLVEGESEEENDSRGGRL